MLTRETSRVMRFLSADSAGADLSPFFASSLDWPESSRAKAQRATTGYSFFMSGESIIGWGAGREMSSNHSLEGLAGVQNDNRVWPSSISMRRHRRRHL